MCGPKSEGEGAIREGRPARIAHGECVHGGSVPSLRVGARDIHRSWDPPRDSGFTMKGGE